MAKILIENSEGNVNVSVRTYTNGNVTPLYLACSRRHSKIVSYLLSSRWTRDIIDVFARNVEDQSLSIHVAAHYGCYSCVDSLLDFDPSLALLQGPDQQNVLHFLLQRRPQSLSSTQRLQLYELIKRVLRIAPELRYSKIKSTQVNTITIAAQTGDVELLRILLSFNRTEDSSYPLLKWINERANAKVFGVTPLLMAAQNGFEDVVQFLLENGADPNLPLTEYDTTPLFVASERGWIKVVQVLMEFNFSKHDSQYSDIDVQKSSKEGLTAVHIACHQGHVDIVKFFFKKGITIAVQYNAKGEVRHLSDNDIDSFCSHLSTKKKKKSKLNILFRNILFKRRKNFNVPSHITTKW
ncbi:ankyrin repeat protein [Reticulomyxa filosa]|uniref:Ankyrin repeat protein n=1 Tax=Reticulomyxa filosa TaxID=46433 RepID=X6NV21_RETFI|nr:ankyrin repeat protein [Reticulomyxa filosa]|eukprot:ETO29649.1 ankyrin repeat protein [Reticulomyxa filosa]